MTPPNKLHGLLGMAKRAGKLCVGFDATVYAVKDGNAALVIIAADGSAKTEKECRFAAERTDTAVVRLPLDRNAFAQVIGAAKPVAVAAVCDDGFANAIRSYCNETKEEDSL